MRHLPTGFIGDASGSVLRFSLGPDRLTLEISVNGGEDPFALRRAELSADLGLGAQRAYADVLAAVLDGDVPLEDYPAGSAGPDGWTGPPTA